MWTREMDDGEMGMEESWEGALAKMSRCDKIGLRLGLELGNEYISAVLNCFE
jgi:hypothetical protein